MLCLPRFPLPAELLPEGVELWVKRDDLSGMQLSGNKVWVERGKGEREGREGGTWTGVTAH